MLYGVVLLLHSWLRWAVVVLAVVVLTRALATSRGARESVPGDRKLGTALVAALDFQVLLGLLLYFVLSPYVPHTGPDYKAVMKNSMLRFFAVEHITAMLLALIAMHI